VLIGQKNIFLAGPPLLTRSGVLNRFVVVAWCVQREVLEKRFNEAEEIASRNMGASLQSWAVFMQFERAKPR